ncbi:biotin--[acetyl-CoA-carboxylase] ligase [Bordetella sp. N]|uniref:biotin--[acetyl-CoA-carboxylase] ligase n=1 Tax=Bordetella sp. N TaxID=1746199 RepID=UPI00070CB708|nr:biotin--[acetyl-CoA-carboxylase] ligase [Bordetella sp. N]ALM85271.1 biotin--protein ligase [Bordetella sp. N]
MSEVFLPSPATLAEQIHERLPQFGGVDWVRETGSTNADLLEQARLQVGGRGLRPWLRGAHLQNTGRGRAGRNWQNQPGQALMFSCAFDTTLAAAELPALSPLAGLAAVEALRSLAGPGADGLRVKWPNDVMFGKGKLSGVLVETTRNPVDRSAGHVVVIGMGTNLVDADLLSRELDRPIADWTGVGAPALEIADIVAAVARAWQDAIVQLQAFGFQVFIDRFARVDALAGRTVRVLDRGEVLQTGTAAGTDRHGRLLVKTGTRVTPVSVGEISVRAT